MLLSKNLANQSKAFSDSLDEYIELHDTEDQQALRDLIDMACLLAQGQVITIVKERFSDVIPLTFFVEQMDQLNRNLEPITARMEDK